MAYPLDQPIVLTFQSYSDAGGTTLADATTVTLDLQKPDGTVSTLTLAAGDIVRVSLGTYSYTFTPATSGHYAFHWKATGPAAAQTAADGEFDVQVKFGAGDPLDILTLDEAKAAISNNAGAANDALLAVYVTGISRFLDAQCGPIVRRTVTDEEAFWSGGDLFLKNWPVVSVTSVTEYAGTAAQVLSAENFPSATTANDYRLVNGGAGGMVQRRANGYPVNFAPQARVLVTYVAGRYADTASVDSRFKMAAGIVLANFWRGEHGLSGEEAGVRFALPYAAETLLAADMRVRVA